MVIIQEGFLFIMNFLLLHKIPKMLLQDHNFINKKSFLNISLLINNLLDFQDSLLNKKNSIKKNQLAIFLLFLLIKNKLKMILNLKI